MQKITFLRHYKLQFPFDHWTHMSLKEYVGLGNGSLNPSIDKDSIQDFIKANVVDEQWEVVISSPTTRCIDTSHYVQKYFDIPHFEVLQSLVESPWILDEPITECEFNCMKEEKKLTVKTRRVECITERMERAEQIIQEIKKFNYKSILVVTHSHMIAVMHSLLTYPDRRIDTFTEEDINKSEIGGYLKGFDYSLQ